MYQQEGIPTTGFGDVRVFSLNEILGQVQEKVAAEKAEAEVNKVALAAAAQMTAIKNETSKHVDALFNLADSIDNAIAMMADQASRAAYAALAEDEKQMEREISVAISESGEAVRAYAGLLVEKYGL